MSYKCRDCGNTFLQEPTCSTCGAQRLYDATVTTQQATIERLRRELAEAREAYDRAQRILDAAMAEMEEVPRG